MSAAAGKEGVRIGLVGKLPAHGDFVRRGSLPASFVAPWDAWLQDGIAAARAAIGAERFDTAWDVAPAWRFALPGGACGPDPAAGVLLPSRDSVGRRFPLTLAAVGDGAPWPAEWFAALEGAARAALALGQDADALAAAMPPPPSPSPPGRAEDPMEAFWASVAADATAGTETGPDPHEDPSPRPPDPAMMDAAGAAEVSPGWWTAAAADGTPGLVWPLPALPGAEEFVLLLESEA